MTERIWDRFLTDKDKRIYELSGYGKLGGFGKRPALFIIDVQNDFISGSLAIINCPAGQNGEDVRDNKQTNDK